MVLECSQGRDSRLSRLMERLYQEDELLLDHSWKEMRSLNDADLLEYLIETYQGEELVTGRLSFVRREKIREGDEIVLSGRSLIVDHNFSPVMGATGIVRKIFSSHFTSGNILVDWGDGLRCKVLDSEIAIYGRKGGWLRKEKRFPLTRGDMFYLRKNDLVKYVSERRALGKYIPSAKGMRGKVILNEGGKIYLTIPGNDNIIVRPNLAFTFPIQIRKNNIDFASIYRECYGDDQ